MATNVGKLLVEIQASTATFQQDLGKAVSMVDRSTRQMSVAFAGLQGVIAGVVGGLSVDAFVNFAKDTIHSAAALDDLADATGSTVEHLSKLKNQAEISGTSFETLQGLMLKLSAGMAGADEESSNVGRALKALGVTAKDPALALQEVAKALAGYADGIGKAAIARDLFGKGGPAFLATLKDIAELSDVQATVTAKQAAEAEQLEKAWRRLSVESTTLKNAVLSDLVPALLDLIANFRLAREAGEGFFGAMLRAGTNVSNLPDQISRAAAALDDVRKAAAAGANNPLRILPGLVANDEDVRAAEAKYRALIAIRDRTILAGQGDNADQVSRRFQTKPTLDYTGAKDAKDHASARERISDAQRYLERLQQQLQKTEDLSVVETVLADIQSKRLKLSGDVTQQQLIEVAMQIDTANALKKSEQDRQKLLADEARTREQISRMTLRAVEAARAETASIAEQNIHYREETELIGKDVVSIAEIIQARLDAAIATKQQTLASLQNISGMDAEAAAVEDQIRLLQQRKGLLIERGIATRVADDAAKAKAINDLFVNSFADSVTSVVTGAQSVGDAFRSMERQIVASLTRLAAQNIGKAIFGAATSSGGGGFASGIGAFFQKLIGGGSGFASGTNFAPGGIALVGERGPELVNLPRGAQVISNDALTSRRSAKAGHSLTFNINVLPGASRETASQAAMRTGIEVQRALASLG